MKNRLNYIAGIILISFLVLPNIAIGNDKSDSCESTTWRVQSFWPRSSDSHEGSMIAVKDEISKRTEGRVNLDVYSSGELFGDKQIFDAVGKGVVEMGSFSPAYVQNDVPLAAIASGLPFAWNNTMDALYFYKIAGFEKMLRKEAAKKGVYWATDKVYPTEMVSKIPIHSMDDFKDLKIRSSGKLQEFLSEAGASASYIPGSEIYTALSSGVVNAAHFGGSQGALTLNMYEIAKFHIKPPLTVGGTSAFAVNVDALNSLCGADRKAIKNALNDHFWRRTIEYEYGETVAMAEAEEKYGVEVSRLPSEVVDKLSEIARDMRSKMDRENADVAKALDMMESLRDDMGY